MKILTITEAEYQEHVDNDEGLCLNCLKIREDFTESDAEDYFCDFCEENKVAGFEHALELGAIEFE